MECSFIKEEIGDIMQRYFCDNRNDDKFIIIGDDHHHIKNVMRMQVTSKVYVCSNKTTYLCEIIELNESEIILGIIETIDEERELPINITIAQGLPKGDKADTVVLKGTEYGAHKFYFVNSERTIVKYDNKKADKKIVRWQKIAKEASEQSHRQEVPNVEAIISFKELLNLKNNYDLLLYAYENEAGKKSLSWINIEENINNLKNILIFIGPEGGISEKEAQKLSDNGFETIDLGRRIHRTETAGLYFLSVISYLTEK